MEDYLRVVVLEVSSEFLKCSHSCVPPHPEILSVWGVLRSTVWSEHLHFRQTFQLTLDTPSDGTSALRSGGDYVLTILPFLDEVFGFMVGRLAL